MTYVYFLTQFYLHILFQLDLETSTFTYTNEPLLHPIHIQDQETSMFSEPLLL